MHNALRFVNRDSASNSRWVRSAHGNQRDLGVKLHSGVLLRHQGMSPLPRDVGMPKPALKEVAEILQAARCNFEQANVPGSSHVRNQKWQEIGLKNTISCGSEWRQIQNDGDANGSSWSEGTLQKAQILPPLPFPSPVCSATWPLKFRFGKCCGIHLG